MPIDIDRPAAREARSFRTRSGVCELSESRLEFTHTGARDWVSSMIYGASMIPGLAVYAVIGLASLAFGLDASLSGRWSDGVFDAGLGLVVLALAWVDRHRSTASSIELVTIERIVALAPSPPNVPARIDIWFHDGRRQRCRYVVLSGSLDGGVEEFEKACGIFRAAGLLEA